MAGSSPDGSAAFEVPRAYALEQSLTMQRMGPFDPTARAGPRRFAKTGCTPEGGVTVELSHEPAERRVVASAWGPGSKWVLERVPDWLGASDRPEELDSSGPMGELARRAPGLRLPRSPFPGDLHLGFVVQQRVTAEDAMRSFQALARRYGTPAPGPLGLTTFPDSATLRRVPSHAFFEVGIESKRMRSLLEAARLGRRLQSLARETPLESIRKLLHAVAGTGPWTRENVMGFGFGDPDAVPVGDVHLPHIVSYALAGEPFTSDERMLELLEPYRGQRFRVIRLIMTAGPRRPRAR